MKSNRELELLLCKANCLLEQRAYEQLLESFDRSLLDLDDIGPVWQMRGIAYFALGRMNVAMAAFEHASLLIPLATEAQCQLAECYLRIRQRESATAIYIHLALLPGLSEQVSQCVAEGLLRLGQHETGLDFCIASLRRFRENHRLLTTATSVMRQLSLSNESILPYAQQAHFSRPADLSGRIVYARHLSAANRFSEATSLLRAINLNEVDCVASLQRLRWLYQELGDTNALEHCNARLQQIHYEVCSSFRPPRNQS